jgi:uncharacterized coiled-coil protein SlyX
LETSSSRERELQGRAAGIRQLWIFAVALAVILIGLGCVLLQRGVGGAAGWASSATAHEQVSNELLETTKGLQATQQQVVQDQLVAQKAETIKLSEQIAALTEKLNALQVASAPAVTAPVSPPKR